MFLDIDFHHSQAIWLFFKISHVFVEALNSSSFGCSDTEFLEFLMISTPHASCFTVLVVLKHRVLRVFKDVDVTTLEQCGHCVFEAS